MPANGIITLTSDFGYSDPYTGIMKGVMISKNKNLRFIDISHEISPQNIFEAAMVLKAAYKEFPPGTTHLVVVDPGVGSSCRRLCARSQSYNYIFPDNGVMDLVFSEDPVIEAGEIRTSQNVFISKTFHGRDIFAPAAASLASGKSIGHIAELCNPPEPMINIPDPNIIQDRIEGFEIIYTDRFGNMCSNFQSQMLTGITMKSLSINQKNIPVCKSYSDVENGALGIIINSWGFFEIFARNGSAKNALFLKGDEKIQINQDVF